MYFSFILNRFPDALHFPLAVIKPSGSLKEDDRRSFPLLEKKKRKKKGNGLQPAAPLWLLAKLFLARRRGFLPVSVPSPRSITKSAILTPRHQITATRVHCAPPAPHIEVASDVRASWHLSPSVGVRACVCVSVCAVWCLREDEEGSRGFFAGLCLALSALMRRRATLKQVQELPGRRGSESGLSRNYQPGSGGGETSAGVTGGGGKGEGVDQPANTCTTGRGCAAVFRRGTLGGHVSLLIGAGGEPARAERAKQTEGGRRERERERYL